MVIGLSLYFGYSTVKELEVLQQEVSDLHEEVKELTTEVEGYSGKLLKILNAVSRY